jgi:acetyl-CoA carboxylase/biotin carboxylase 1
MLHLAEALLLQVVFVRGLSHGAGLTTETGARRALLQGLDELERAQSN